MANIEYRIMCVQDYEKVFALWKSIDGFYVRSIDDSKEGMRRFLDKNPNTNIVALCDEKVIGSVLCGYDGRCAYFYHVCVQREYRHKRVGKSMVDIVIDTLKKEGATHINLVAFKTNEVGNLFWHEVGWQMRDNLNLYEFILNPENVRTLNQIKDN